MSASLSSGRSANFKPCSKTSRGSPAKPRQRSPCRGSAADAIAQAGKFDDNVFLEVGSAKIRTAEAAAEGSAIAHQVFGAIGFTQEHVLHRFTLRMLSWRDDFGNESYWAAELGKRAACRGADEFWPLVASR